MGPTMQKIVDILNNSKNGSALEVGGTISNIGLAIVGAVTLLSMLASAMCNLGVSTACIQAASGQ